MSNSKKYSKEDCYKNLENMNAWICNSDTKTSIVIGLLGIIITVLLTNNGFINNYIDIFEIVFKNIDFSDVLYTILTMISFVMIFFGIYKLIKVLIPTLNLKNGIIKPSHLFFGSIANFESYTDFKMSLDKETDDDIIDDILNQVYINSKICVSKFINFKSGLKYSLLGIILFIALFIIGFLIYK